MDNDNRRAAEIEAAWREHNRSVQHPAIWRDRTLLHRLSEAQNWRCCYCGCRDMQEGGKSPRRATFEHIIPLARGGRDHEDNIAIACYRCNKRRADLMFSIHFEVVSDMSVLELRKMATYLPLERRPASKQSHLPPEVGDAAC